MTQISIQAIKGRLSSAVAEAERGATIVITRHNKPVAQLTSARAAHVQVGARHGRSALKPAVTTNTKGRYLAVLREDREGGHDR